MCSSFILCNYKSVKLRFLSWMDELLKLLVVTTRLGRTFLFCYNCSSHPSGPCYHYSPSYSLTSLFFSALSYVRYTPFVLVAKQQCALFWQVAFHLGNAVGIPSFWAACWFWLADCLLGRPGHPVSLRDQTAQSVYLVALLSTQGVWKFPRRLYPGP